MKIFYIHGDPLEHPNPSSTFVLNRLQGFFDSSHQIVLFVRKENSKSTDAILRDSYDINELPNNTRIVRISSRNSLIYSLKVILAISKEYKAGDVLVTRALRLVPYLYHYCKLIQAKFLFESHDFYYDLGLRDDIEQRKKQKSSRIERKYLDKLDGLICVNKSQIPIYQKYLKIPILANHCGVPRFNAHPKVKHSNQKVLGYVGSVCERKSLASIIKLVSQLDESYKLIIIGVRTEAEKARLDKYIQTYGVEHKIEVTNWLNKAELNQKLNEIDLGLIPLSNTFFNKHLTYPLKVVDYFSRGIPVLTNDFPSARSYLTEGETGFFVDWEDIVSTKQTVESYFKSHSAGNMMVSSLENFCRNNSTKTNSQKLVELIDTV